MGSAPRCAGRDFDAPLLRDVGRDIFEMLYVAERGLPVHYHAVLRVAQEMERASESILDALVQVKDFTTHKDDYLRLSSPMQGGDMFFECRKEISLKGRKDHTIFVTYSLYGDGHMPYGVYAERYEE